MNKNYLELLFILYEQIISCKSLFTPPLPLFILPSSPPPHLVTQESLGKTPKDTDIKLYTKYLQAKSGFSHNLQPTKRKYTQCLFLSFPSLVEKCMIFWLAKQFIAKPPRHLEGWLMP